MTVMEAITQADARRHNGYSLEEKLRWLSQLDGKLSLMVLKEHEGQTEGFSGYGLSTPMDTVLLVKAPFDEIYLYWLDAQICYADGEIADYNAAIAQYNRLYAGFVNGYKGSHMPLQKGRRFLF